MNWKKGLKRIAICLTLLYIPLMTAHSYIFMPKIHADQILAFAFFFPIILWSTYFSILWIANGFKK